MSRMSIEDYKKRISYGEPFMKTLSNISIKDIVAVIEKIWENSCGNFYNTIESGDSPLSSMTNEQLFEVSEILGKDVVIFSDYLLTINNCRKSFSYQELDTLFNWFDKNHFDYRGLIPMGLAIDATGLNIY